MTTADLDAYLQRIGYDGSRAPTLATLSAIHRHHALAIPFENLTPFLKQPVRLDVPSLVQKIVDEGRGGYCFEHNLLLRAVLTTLGFEVSGLAARVRWNVPDEVITSRGHMLLRVELDQQTYIADVGFGGLTLTAPLRLVTEAEQQTPHEPFRLLLHGSGYSLQAKLDQAWKPLYTFDLQEQYQPDYEVTNWYLSNHPESHFVTGLIVARPDVDRRYALRNNHYAVRHLDGTTERQTVTTVPALCAILADTFRITLPDASALEPALQRLIERTD
jgi:N-hydroxyarylamine O-acetyltransferase